MTAAAADIHSSSPTSPGSAPKREPSTTTVVNNTLPGVRVLDLTVTDATLELVARQLAVDLSLASADDTRAAKVTRCTQGITNKLVKVSLPSGLKFLVRIYGPGTHHLIDRAAETRNLHTLATLGLAPPLYATLRNGLVYGYVSGTAAHPAALAHPRVSRAVATHLAEWHSTVPVPAQGDVAIGGGAGMWPVLDRWLAMVREAAAPNERLCGLSLAELTDERMRLERELPPSPVVFAHNDLLCGNIVLQHDSAQTSVDVGDDDGHAESEDELRAVIGARFIDYEYGGLNAAAFDIANHFNEWAGFECEYWRYPDVEAQREFLATYLARTHQHQGGRGVTEEEVETWRQAVQQWTLASHLYWIVWAMVQSTMSDIDFDYADYARQRWAEYERWRASPEPPARPST
ncbi:kinase-like domain-containing protein [Blastocladiella britannica]|nr:kinase-like domain-containing protein [Blastocladiella britannica]